MADIHCDYGVGDDTTGDGSAGNPYKTLQKAVDVCAASGDFIWVGDSADQVLSASIDWTTGYAGVLTTIRGWDQSAGAGVAGVGTIDGNSAVTTLFSITSMPANVTLFQMILKGGTSTQASMPSTGHLVQCEVDGSAGSSHGITYATGAGSVVDCYVHGCGGTGIRMTASSGYSVGNHLSGNGNPAIDLQGDYSVCEDCLVQSAGAIGIRMQGVRPLCKGNTVYDTASGTHGFDVQVSGGVFLNNIIVGFTNGIRRGGVNNKPQVQGYNHFFGNTTNYQGSVTPFTDIGNDETTDPGFTAAGSGDYSVGVNARAQGWPPLLRGSSTYNFRDTGVAQRQEPARLLTHPGMSGGMSG